MAKIESNRSFRKRKAGGLMPNMSGFLIMADLNTVKSAMTEVIQIFEEYIINTKLGDVDSQDDGLIVPEEREESIEDELTAELGVLRSKACGKQGAIFRPIITDANCIGFLHVPDITKLRSSSISEFLVEFLESFSETSFRCRFAHRIVPVETTSYAADMLPCLRKLLDKHLNSTTALIRTSPENILTFSVVFKSRLNDKIARDTTISVVANEVTRLDPLLAVDLKNPDIVIIVEVITSLCALAICRKFNEFSRFNLKLLK